MTVLIIVDIILVILGIVILTGRATFSLQAITLQKRKKRKKSMSGVFGGLLPAFFSWPR